MKGSAEAKARSWRAALIVVLLLVLGASLVRLTRHEVLMTEQLVRLRIGALM